MKLFRTISLLLETIVDAMPSISLFSLNNLEIPFILSWKLEKKDFYVKQEENIENYKFSKKKK